MLVVVFIGKSIHVIKQAAVLWASCKVCPAGGQTASVQNIMVEAGNVTGASVSVMVADSEAQRILEEASEVAAQRMSSQFPQLPETLRENQENSQSARGGTA